MKEKTITITDIDIEEPVESQNMKKRTKSPPKKPNKIRALLTNKIFLIGLTAFVLSLTATTAILYSIFAIDVSKPEDLVSFNPEFLKVGAVNDIVFTAIAVSDPSEPRTKINPINGELLTEKELSEYQKRNPVAVMINNHVAARPQSGLPDADIVYETIAESGITRYMGVYWSNPIEKVGPIRSIRQYYLEWLSEFDAIVIHDGYASSDDLRIDAGGNMWRYGTKTISTQGAWRDNTRFAPHNEYSSVANAMEIGEAKNWVGLPNGFKSWSFKPDAPKDSRGKIETVVVSPHDRLPNGGLYDATWEYDISTNTFMRSIGGSPSTDLDSGQQVSSKTVVIQLVDLIPSGDDKAHNIIKTIDKGDAVILMDGKQFEATWEKPSRTERTVFFDSKGNEFIFNRGQIWVTGLSTNDGSFDIIEQ